MCFAYAVGLAKVGVGTGGCFACGFLCPPSYPCCLGSSLLCIGCFCFVGRVGGHPLQGSVLQRCVLKHADQFGVQPRFFEGVGQPAWLFPAFLRKERRELVRANGPEQTEVMDFLGALAGLCFGEVVLCKAYRFNGSGCFPFGEMAQLDEGRQLC